MALFEIGGGNSLVPFRQLRGGAELYEREIEDLVWDNLDDFLGGSLFRVARQPQIGSGGRPDIVALDAGAHVVVIEIKRDVDRRQLAQCLEYAGWARSASLDEVAGIYHLGAERFFADWQEFTESDVPLVISRPPRLVLVAREFHGRTRPAFEYLAENGVPIEVVEVSIYEDEQQRRFVDVGVDAVEPQDEPIGASVERDGRVHTLVGGRRVRLVDLLDAGLVTAGQELTWERPRLGQTYRAQVTANGSLRLEDGRTFSSPSTAATRAADIPAYDGWLAWKAGGVLLRDLRDRLVQDVETDNST
jgi:Restriction Enzyme Adenine Methylase Associated/Archaeal holliday junction resolvase (hjc)